MIHIGNNFKSRIVSKIISIGKSRNYYRGLVQVQPNSHNARNFSQCDSILIGDRVATNTYPYIQVQLSCILKSLISFIDSPSCVLVSLNFIVVGLEWVKKSSISLSKIDTHMSLHVIVHTLFFIQLELSNMMCAQLKFLACMMSPILARKSKPRTIKYQ